MLGSKKIRQSQYCYAPTTTLLHNTDVYTRGWGGAISLPLFQYFQLHEQNCMQTIIIKHGHNQQM